MRKSKSKEIQLPHKKPLFIVLSGPSGAGKDVVLNKLRQSRLPLTFITTVTTRAPRTTEKNNADYHFVSVDEFQRMSQSGELLERANVYGNWYGVPKPPIKQALDRGEDVIVKVDVQGAATIKRIVPQAIFIFLTPPSIEELKQRLRQRNTESSEDLMVRLRKVREEMKQLPLFDYLVVNSKDKIDEAVSEIRAIIAAEKCRTQPREISPG